MSRRSWSSRRARAGHRAPTSTAGAILIAGASLLGGCKPANTPDDLGVDGAVVEPDREWAQWPMPPETPPDSLYVLQAETVLDQMTGLRWQRVPSVDRLPWSEATAACAGLRLDGEGGWRLPTTIELMSLLSIPARPPINPLAFPSTPTTATWTATPSSATARAAWTVDFSHRYVRVLDTDMTAAFRCVRAGAHPAADRLVLEDSVVRDQATGLDWERQATRDPTDQESAAARCAALSIPGGSKPWRLPTYKELATIVDRRRASPAIDPLAFPATAAEPHWTSTVDAPGHLNANWLIDFATGSSLYDDRSRLARSRCVR